MSVNVTNDNGRRELGELTATVRALSAQMETYRQETREDFRRMFEKMEGLQASGCAVGRANAERIGRLENAPARSSSTVWANIGSLAAGALAGLAWWRSNQ